jgi:hypothetical protein
MMWRQLALVKVIDKGTQQRSLYTARINVEKPPRAEVLMLISDASRNIYAAKPASYPGPAGHVGADQSGSGHPRFGPYPVLDLTGEQALR